MKRPERLVERSFEMILASYYLARCGQVQDGAATLPPRKLNVEKWKDAYDIFFEAMGDGREPKQFGNSMKNARDTFDTLFPNNGRRGWVDENGLQPQLGPTFQRVHDEWKDRTDSELENFVFRLISGTPESTEELLGGTVALTEGGLKVVTSLRRERDPKLRKLAIQLHGLSCAACDFSFEKVYGEWGMDFIEVHHVAPLSDSGITKTDPKTDLSVLCSNCHRMVHRKKGTVLTIAELRKHMGR